MEKRRQYTDEFKSDAVRLLRSRGTRSAEDVAKSIGVSESMLWRWSKTHDGGGSKAGATSAEPRETETLRKRVRELEMENALLKKAAAFFAKETL